MSLPRAYRLPAGEIKTLLRSGAIRSAEVAVLRFRRRQSGNSRFAVLISKKIASSSVKRNALRRRINGWLLRNLSRINPAFDILVVLKGKASELARRELYAAMEELFKKTRAL